MEEEGENENRGRNVQTYFISGSHRAVVYNIGLHYADRNGLFNGGSFVGGVCFAEK